MKLSQKNNFFFSKIIKLSNFTKSLDNKILQKTQQKNSFCPKAFRFTVTFQPESRTSFSVIRRVLNYFK